MDGTEGTVDLSQLVMGKEASVFAALRDPEVFAQVGLDYGAVVWPGEIDLAIKAHGRWTPE
jgi:Protein of unknown function (DUF2442)